MSGGHYNHKCFEVSGFANNLKVDLSKKSVTNLYQFSAQTLKNLKKAQKILEKAGDLAHAVEWLMSGDTGQDYFNKEFERIAKKR